MRRESLRYRATSDAAARELRIPGELSRSQRSLYILIAKSTPRVKGQFPPGALPFYLDLRGSAVELDEFGPPMKRIVQDVGTTRTHCTNGLRRFVLPWRDLR